MQIQNGQLLTGIGEDLNSLQPLSEDDLKRQPSRNLIPRFFKETVGMKDGSFQDIEMVEILVPGDPKNAPIHKVRPEIIKRFPLHYKAWKSGLDQLATGTPLELVVTGSLLHHLKALNIFSVESLAELNDGQLDQLGTGARQLRERARTILQMKANAASAAKESAKDQEIADLKAMLLKQGEQIAALSKGGKSKKAKVETEDEDEEESDDAPVSKKVPEGAQRVTADKPNLNRARRTRR